VVGSIEKSLSIKEYTLIAFLDIEGAFKNVLPTAITESLTELGVEPPMVRLIHKLLISRMVTATLWTSTQTRLVNRGTPQGGVLSRGGSRGGRKGQAPRAPNLRGAKSSPTSNICFENSYFPIENEVAASLDYNDIIAEFAANKARKFIF